MITAQPNGLLAADSVHVTLGKKEILSNLNFSTEPGEYISIVGPSGAGKSTLLNAIAGHVCISNGHIHIDGKDISETPPHRRPTSTVFQNYALFPHMSNYENIGFPLKLRDYTSAEQSKRIDELATLFQLSSEKLRRLPSEVSGGEQQRVALARAIAWHPPVLLLDEPMAALDPELRWDVRLLLRELHQNQNCTILHVTHSLDEAFDLGQRVAVLLDGEIIQFDKPQSIKTSPSNLAVAKFLGHIIVRRAEDLAFFQEFPRPAEGTILTIPPYALSATIDASASLKLPARVLRVSPLPRSNRTFATISLALPSGSLNPVMIEFDYLSDSIKDINLGLSATDINWFNLEGALVA